MAKKADKAAKPPAVRRASAPAPVEEPLRPEPAPAPSFPPARAPRRRRMLGWWSALFFNLALVGLPLGLVMLVSAMEGVELVRYEATPEALASAKAAVESQAARLAPADMPRDQALSFLVGREVTEGDAEAARGFLMAAGAILPGPDSSRLYQRLKANYSEEDLAAAAVRFLDPALQGAYLQIQSGRAASAGETAFFIVGDERELATAAQRWLLGERTDMTSLVLSGLTVADVGLPAALAEALRVGASVLRSAKAAGRLSPQLSESLSKELALVAPPQALRSALQAALGAPGALADEGGAVALAFKSTLVEAPLRRFAASLQALRGAAAYTSPAGSLYLIAHAQSVADFPRLQLLAQAARERAVAVAKRAPVDGRFLDAAPVTWRWPTPVLVALALIIVCVLAMLVGAMLALQHALERSLRPQDAPAATRPAIAVASTPQLPKPAPQPPAPVS